MFLPGTKIAGRYALIRPFAKGGMGDIWEARHLALGTTVAIKFMATEIASAPSARARFEREARAAATLSSPHVVHVQDFGIDSGSPFIVMERLIGEDLSTRLNEVKRLPLGDLARILAQAARALRKAHEIGIVHRDLKPANIFLAQIDGDEVVKVLDFGIAKDTGGIVSDEGTKTGEIFGSPAYMSPEQLRSPKDVDGRSDVWALGIIAYRALAGRLPFEAEQASGIVAGIIADEPVSVLVHNPELPAAIDTFFQRALAKKVAARYQTVDELAKALVAVLQDPSEAPLSRGDPPSGPVSTPALPRETLKMAALDEEELAEMRKRWIVGKSSEHERTENLTPPSGKLELGSGKLELGASTDRTVVLTTTGKTATIPDDTSSTKGKAVAIAALVGVSVLGLALLVGGALFLKGSAQATTEGVSPVVETAPITTLSPTATLADPEVEPRTSVPEPSPSAVALSEMPPVASSAPKATAIPAKTAPTPSQTAAQKPTAKPAKPTQPAKPPPTPPGGNKWGL